MGERKAEYNKADMYGKMDACELGFDGGRWTDG
jgi:hypothetical protein